MMDIFNWLPALPEASSHHSRRQSCQLRWGWARLAPVQHTVEKRQRNTTDVILHLIKLAIWEDYPFKGKFP